MFNRCEPYGCCTVLKNRTLTEKKNVNHNNSYTKFEGLKTNGYENDSEHTCIRHDIEFLKRSSSLSVLEREKHDSYEPKNGTKNR